MPELDDYEEISDLDDIEVDEETGEVRKVQAKSTPATSTVQGTFTPDGLEIRGSATLLKAYQKCPASAYAKLSKQPSIKDIALFNGSAVHEALELYIKNQSDPMTTYERYLIKAAEENKFSLATSEAAEARQVGVRCVSTGIAILNTKNPSGLELWKRLDPKYVERYFCFIRNGRKYTGKMDLIAFMDDPDKYVPVDWKTGKRAPDQYELDNDIQFDMYPYACYVDQTAKTFGKWMHHATYSHLRGHILDKVKPSDPTSKRMSLAQWEKANPATRRPLQFDFRTNRTLEQVENKFDTVIEPIMKKMELGFFERNFAPSYGCQSCEYFVPDKMNKKMGHCGVQLPCDAKTTKSAIDLISLMAETNEAPKQLPSDSVAPATMPLEVKPKAIRKKKS